LLCKGRLVVLCFDIVYPVCIYIIVALVALGVAHGLYVFDAYYIALIYHDRYLDFILRVNRNKRRYHLHEMESSYHYYYLIRSLWVNIHCIILRIIICVIKPGEPGSQLSTTASQSIIDVIMRVACRLLDLPSTEKPLNHRSKFGCLLR